MTILVRGEYMFEIVLNSLEDTKRFTKVFSSLLKRGDVFSFVGDLGAGKTTITKEICKNLDVLDDVTSPTFNLVNTYYGKFEINHMDLYRIDFEEELLQIDYENYFYPNGVTIIEWAKNGGSLIPRNVIEIEILKIDENSRKIVIDGKNNREKEIIEGLKNENFSC